MKFVQVTPEELTDLINSCVKNHLDSFKKDLSTLKANDELLTRTEACEFLKINSTTLWNWTNKGKIPVYSYVNRRYYKRSELMDCLTLLKK